jgi:type I restriction enzyme S subunit
LRSEKLEKVKLNEVTQVLKRGISPKYVEDDGIVVFNQKCIRNHIVSFGDARLTGREKKISEERLLQKYDTLVNSTGAGTLGRIAMNIQDEITSTVDSHITIVRANGKVTPIFLAQSLLAQESIIENMGEGSTNQTELSPRKLGEEIKISIPTRNVMIEFENQSIPNFNLIWNLQKQNTKLREARDILLPRLMSGEIVV